MLQKEGVPNALVLYIKLKYYVQYSDSVNHVL